MVLRFDTGSGGFLNQGMFLGRQKTALFGCSEASKFERERTFCDMTT